MNSSVQGQGARRRGMVPVTVTLAAGSVQRRWQIEGDYFHVSSAPVNDLIVRFDSGNGIPLSQGMGITADYSEFSVESATGQTVTVFAGYGLISDNRANVTANLAVTLAPSNTMFDGADVAVPSGAATLVLAADLNRKTAFICNPSTNTATVRVGSATVNATKGIPVEPGETLTLDATFAVYVFQASGTAVTVSAAAIELF